jgi:2-iminobutanoate/2-iminopropanoate deaminase
MPKEVLPTPPGGPERMPGMVSGVRAGGFLFFSAIRGRDPATNQISDDPRIQTRQVFENLKLLLESAGATLDDVVKVTLYLDDLRHRTVFHEIWMEYFPRNPPARIAIQVADANAAPGGNAHFALDVIALAG